MIEFAQAAFGGIRYKNSCLMVWGSAGRLLLWVASVLRFCNEHFGEGGIPR